MTPKTVGLIVFEQMAVNELTGPAEAFSRARMAASNGRECHGYQILTLGIGTAPCVTECGVIIRPQLDIKDAPELDTLIVPGGSGIGNTSLNKTIAKWLSRRVPVTRRIVTFSTGIYALAATGLLDRREVAVHWRIARDVAVRFPELQIDDNAIFLKDGQFYTSAGATAGIDLTLSLIEEDYGARVALAVARELVVYLKRPGGQEQYSEPLQFQTQSISRLTELATWMLSHLHEDLSVETLAAKACLCPRHFSRRFKIEFGTAPADFVERLRLDEARRRLSNGDNSVENVGTSVGFRSADSFRRAFERRLGVNPSDYRRRFATGSSLSAVVDRRRDSNGFTKAA
jgi:transcriptional regulator GlxA family with amidase domain